MKKGFSYIILILSVFSSVITFAQPALFNNKGAEVFTNYNSIVKIKGSMNNDVNGIFENNGTSTIDSNFYNNWQTQGNGNYRVGGDWVNNRTFICDTSDVYLWGNNQFIRGDSVTTYWELELQGGGIKTQQIRSFVKKELRLNDRELATDTFYMHVLNVNPTAITRTTGFVSSLGNGKLRRSTQQQTAYLFPTGSSIGTTRYRPVDLTPEDASQNTFAVRMANNDATLDGYDRTSVDSFVCKTNPNFYHWINRPAGSAYANVKIYYDLAADSSWDGLAHWKNQPIGFWNDMKPVTFLTALPLNSVEKVIWSDYNPQPFILSRIRPGVPVVTGPDTICGAYNGLYTAMPDSNDFIYNWTIVNGNVINQPDQNTATVNWGPGGVTGSVTATLTNLNGCTSYPYTINVQVYEMITANFIFSPNGTFGSEPVVFVDQSTNANAWDWTFGDNSESELQNPTHIYPDQGSYQVMMIASSKDGCKDTAFADVTVIGGLVIPNIFTPNGDGVNDLFEISGTGFKNFKCLIYNRWGNLMFESQSAQIQWDGTTLAGEKSSAGVYFVVLEIETTTTPIIYKGTVTIKY